MAAYARYSSPYVWVRSNHERIVKLNGKHDKDKDNPLKLSSTQKWLKDGMIMMSPPSFLSHSSQMNIRQKQTCVFCQSVRKRLKRLIVNLELLDILFLLLILKMSNS